MKGFDVKKKSNVN